MPQKRLGDFGVDAGPSQTPEPEETPPPAEKLKQQIGEWEVVKGEYFLSHERHRCSLCGQEFIIDPEDPQDAKTKFGGHNTSYHGGLAGSKLVKYKTKSGMDMKAMK